MYLLGPGNGCFFLTDLFAAAQKNKFNVLIKVMYGLINCQKMF